MASTDPFSSSSARRSRWPAIIAGVVIAFLAGLAAATLLIDHYGAPWSQAPATKDGQPVARPASTSIASGTPAASETDYDALAAREAALAARLSDLEARTATIDTQAAAASGKATRAEGLLVAFAARRALDRGLGLGYIEGQLRARFGATQPRAVATVISASRAPVTLEDLRLGLASIGPDMVRSDNVGWLAGLRSGLSNLIVVHKAGAPSPRPSDRLERARHLLEGGQVEAALAELSRLPGASKAQRWINAAHRYVAARRALDVIETAALIGQAHQPASVPAPSPSAAPADGKDAAAPAVAPAPAQHSAAAATQPAAK